MRMGSTGSDPAPQHTDHEIVRRLRAAGAIVVGLTRVPELCVFGATDSGFGITRNPWDLGRTPGGSSGGAAAAVAAGMVPAAHGNDGMGSIRIPSACCGLVGIKPGLGVVPADLGNGSWFDMAENGPLATTVDDAALLLSVMAGRPDLATVPHPGTLRIAVSTKAPLPGTPVDEHWAAGVRETADLLRGAGHTVHEKNPPYGQVSGGSELVRWFAGTELDARLLADRDQLAVRTRRHAAAGRLRLPRQGGGCTLARRLGLGALRWRSGAGADLRCRVRQPAAGRLALRFGLPRDNGRERWRRRAEGFFADLDLLVTPTLAQPPIVAKAWARKGWLANIWANTHFAPFAAHWNLAGWPAMAVPAGLHPNGTPLSVQLVAKPGGETMLLALAAQLEQLRPWPRTALTAD